jgi:hypothetical protein
MSNLLERARDWEFIRESERLVIYEREREIGNSLAERATWSWCGVLFRGGRVKDGDEVAPKCSLYPQRRQSWGGGGTFSGPKCTNLQGYLAQKKPSPLRTLQ